MEHNQAVFLLCFILPGSLPLLYKITVKEGLQGKVQTLFYTKPAGCLKATPHPQQRLVSCSLQGLLHLTLAALLLFLFCCFYFTEGEIDSERINALSEVTQNFNGSPFQPCSPLSHSLETCLPQAKRDLSSIPLNCHGGILHFFLHIQDGRLGGESLSSGQGGAEAEIETSPLENEGKVGTVRL